MFAIDQVTNEYDNNNDILDENKSEAESSKEKEPKKIRKWFLKIITSPWFERVSMFVIILNCITLGMYKPCEDQPKCTSTRCFILEYIDHAIYAFFVIEMIIKILAMGFIGRNTYLAESWNRLDFLIVIAR
jgi:hypothetical protein